MRVCVDQISNGFGLQDVELPVQHSATGEFTWLRLPGAGRDQRRDYRRRDEQSAMCRYLDDIVAGKGVRPGEDRDQGLIEWLAVRMHRDQLRSSRLGLPGTHVPGGYCQCFRTAQSYDRDGSTPGCGRDRDNGIVQAAGHGGTLIRDRKSACRERV